MAILNVYHQNNDPESQIPVSYLRRLRRKQTKGSAAALTPLPSHGVYSPLFPADSNAAAGACRLQCLGSKSRLPVQLGRSAARLSISKLGALRKESTATAQFLINSQFII